MNNIITFFAYLIINSVLFNLASRIGWNFDPGILGPMLLAFNINLMLAVFNSAKRDQ